MTTLHPQPQPGVGTVYLTGVSTDLARQARHPHLGLLAQPDSHVTRDVEAGHYAYFAADNGFYGLGAKADPTPEQDQAAVAKWLRWLAADVAPLADRCLFATVPDVLRWITTPDGKRVPVGDAEATLARYAPLALQAAQLGLVPALVLQDGLTLDGDHLVAGSQRLPWSVVGAVFVGGSDVFKLGPDAQAICAEARRRGLWVHVGRVNSWKRLNLVRSWADSADGTYLRFGRKGENWPKLATWLDRLATTEPEPLPLAA